MIGDIKVLLKESGKALLFGSLRMKPYMAATRRLYELSPSALDDYRNECFMSVFRTAVRHSPFYARLYAEAGISEANIRSLDDIDSLPVVTKEMVRNHFAEILTQPKRRCVEYHTSGTTGKPLTLYMPFDVLCAERAHTMITRESLGFGRGERLLSLRGRLDRRYTHLYVPLANTLFLSSYNINEANIDDYIRRIRQFRPRAVEAYPSSLYTLAGYVLAKGCDISIPVAFTSSETLLPHQRDVIERALHTRLFDHYGLTERSIYLTQDSTRSVYREAPGFSYSEYRDDCIITTSLVNKAFPLIRYKVDDVARLEDGKVVAIDGRNDDYMVCRDGTRVNRLDFVFKGVSHVLESQLVQARDGELDINVVPAAGFCDADRVQISENLLDRVGTNNIGFRINMVGRDEIELTPAGKYKFLLKK